MPGCFRKALRFLRCGGRKDEEEDKTCTGSSIKDDEVSHAKSLEESQGESYYENQSISGQSRTSSNKGSVSARRNSRGFSEKTEVELMFESLMMSLEKIPSEASRITRKPDDIVDALNSLLPIARMDYEDGKAEDLINMYTVCSELMTAKVIDEGVYEFLILSNQRLLIWDALVPSEKLLNLSLSYLEQCPENYIVERTRNILELCKADLFRRQGRLNDSLQRVKECQENIMASGDDDDILKTYALTVKSLVLANMLQKDEAAREAEVALKVLKERKDPFSNAVKSELAFIYRVKNSMGALKVLEDVCGIVSLRDGDEESVKVRNARIRLGMWYFLDVDFDKCIALWNSVFVLDKDKFGEDMSWPLGADVESIIGRTYLGFRMSHLSEFESRNVALKTILCIHFFRQRILGAYHPSAKFIENWLTYYILQ